VPPCIRSAQVLVIDAPKGREFVSTIIFHAHRTGFEDAPVQLAFDHAETDTGSLDAHAFSVPVFVFLVAG
jgi:hypothetical protein